MPRVSWKLRSRRARRQLLLCLHFSVKETPLQVGKSFSQRSHRDLLVAESGPEPLDCNALANTLSLCPTLRWVGVIGKEKGGGRRETTRILKNCVFLIGSVSGWNHRIAIPVLLFWDFPEWDTSLISYWVLFAKQAEATRPVDSGSLQVEEDGFGICVLRIPAFCFSVPCGPGALPC